MKHKHGRKSWGKRGITIFLTLSLMVSLLSTAVFAEGDTEDEDSDPDQVVENLVNDNQEEEPQEEEPQGEEPQDADDNGNDGIMLLSLDGDDDDTVDPDTCEHDWGDWDVLWSNCEEKCEERQCKVCWERDYKYTEQGGTHEWSEPYEYSDGCNTFTTRKCTKCYVTDSEWIESNHQFDDWTVLEEAGCGALKSHKCENCGYSEEKYFPNESYTVDDHKWEDWETVWSNCEEAGEGRQCSVCGEPGYRVTKLDGNHVWGEWETVIEPSCREGERIIECTECGTLLDTEYIDPIYDHNFVDDGFDTYGCDTYAVSKCTECGETDRQWIATNHQFGDWTVVEEAGCGALKSHKCENCEYYEEEYFPNESYTGDDHLWGAWELSWSNCEEKYEWRQCTVCGETEGLYSQLDGSHEWGSPVDTSTECEWILTYYCDNCDAFYTETIMSNHVYGEGRTVTTDCETYTVYECTQCGERETYWEETHHQFGDFTVVKKAECGELKGHRCEVCGYYEEVNFQNDSYTGDNHDWGNWVVTQEAKACSTGYQIHECLVCGELDGEYIPMTGNGEHSWSEWDVWKKATACNTGYQHRMCNVCYTSEYEDIPMTGDGVHTWSDWEVLVPATCASGIKARTCEVCGLMMQKLIAPVISGHIHTWSDYSEADFGCEGGLALLYCTAAENSSSDYDNYAWLWEDWEGYVGPATKTVEVAGTGKHDWEVTSAPASCRDGIKISICTICGVEDREFVYATEEHDWGEWSEVAATKCKDSYKVRFCQNEDCYISQMNTTEEEIYHHTASTIKAATCIEATYYQYYTWCTICNNFYFCDENGNQLFDEDGNEYETEEEGYNPNNHAGGTKLVGAVEATATTNGYTGDLYCLGCDELIEAGRIIYPVLNGAASVWTPQTKTGLVIRSNAAKSKFVEVRINGEVLDEKYYTVTEGSTIITISEEYLSTLKDKEYTIEIVSTDGTATTTFTVEGNDAKPDIKDDTKKEEPTGAVDTKKEESTGAAETKKEETVVNTETKKEETTASTTKTDTAKTGTKTNTKSDSASSGAKTGDESSLVLWVSALGISFAALALLTVMNKKRYTGKRVK